MRNKFIIAVVVVGVALAVYAQTQFSLTQSIFINSTDNFPALRAVKKNQSNPWIEFTTGGSPQFQVTSEAGGYAGILTTTTNYGSVTATGWTNNTGHNAFAYITNGAAVTNYDSAGTAYMTNAASSSMLTIFMQNGAFFNAPSGVSGRYHTL